MYYAKCLIANRLSLIGVLLILLSVPCMMWLDGAFFVLAFYGLSALVATGFGYASYSTYLRTRKIIAAKSVTAADAINPQRYCDKVGYQLAVDEAMRRRKFNAEA